MANRKPDPVDNLKSRPSKSILKSSSNFAIDDTSHSSNKNKETTFDEKNIKETLHPAGKEYGHMKIEEPKTPYERLPEEETGKGIDPKALAAKLAKAKGQGHTSSQSRQTPEPSDARHKDFESRRKAHYNEYKKAKEAKIEEDDDD